MRARERAVLRGTGRVAAVAVRYVLAVAAAAAVEVRHVLAVAAAAALATVATASVVAAAAGITSAAAAELPSGDVWLRHATRDLLPFWTHPDAMGVPPGEFPTFRCNDGRLFDPGKPCPELASPPDWIKPEIGRTYVRMQARQTYAYAAAFHLTGERRWLDAARAGAARTLARLDPERGAPAWYRDGKPGVTERETTAQDQAYAVVGIAMLYHVSRDPVLERALVAHERFIFDRLWDDARGELRWVPADGPPGEVSRRELVAQLDQLNAYLLLVVPYLPEADRARWRADIRRVSDAIVRHYHDPASGVFRGTRGLPDSERPGGRHNDFGHTIKAYWMLLLAARELGDRPLEEFAREGAAKILLRAWDGASSSWGSSWTPDGIDANKTWWIFAELDQVASTLALEDRTYATYLAGSWRFWLEKFVDRQGGEVWAGTRADGFVRPNSLKIHHWKNGYHSMEHALVSYLAAQALAGREATLYFATGRRDVTFRPYLLPGTVTKVHAEKGVERVRFRLPARR